MDAEQLESVLVSEGPLVAASRFWRQLQRLVIWHRLYCPDTPVAELIDQARQVQAFVEGAERP